MSLKDNEQGNKNLKEAPILGNVYLAPKENLIEPALSEELNACIIVLDLIKDGKAPLLNKLKEGLKKNENPKLKEKLEHVMSRIENGEFNQTQNDLVTEIELAKTADELEVIDLELRKRKKALLGEANILSESEYELLRTRKAAIRKKLFEPDAVETAKILQDIAKLEEKEKQLAEKHYRALGEQEAKTKLLRFQEGILNALHQKIDHHKDRLEFKRTRNAFLSNLALGMDVIRGATNLLTFIPGLNFIFDAISRTTEITALTLKNAAYNEDKLLDKDLRKAMQEHLAAIRHFMRAELATSVTAVGFLGAGLFFPPVLFAGAGMALISNIISIPRINRAIESEKLRADIPGHENRLKALYAERDAKIYKVMGIIAAIAVAALAFLFPPAGALIIASIILTSVAAAFSAGAIKKELDVKKHDKAAELDREGLSSTEHSTRDLMQTITVKAKTAIQDKAQTRLQDEDNVTSQNKVQLENGLSVKDKLSAEFLHLEQDYQHINEHNKLAVKPPIDHLESSADLSKKTHSLNDFSKHVVDVSKKHSDEFQSLSIVHPEPAQNEPKLKTAEAISYSMHDELILAAHKKDEDTITLKTDASPSKSAIELMAINLIATGDLNPNIEKGHPRNVLHLLQALEEHHSEMTPSISKTILNQVDSSLSHGEKIAFKIFQLKYDQLKKEKASVSEDNEKPENPSLGSHH